MRFVFFLLVLIYQMFLCNFRTTNINYEKTDSKIFLNKTLVIFDVQIKQGFVVNKNISYINIPRILHTLRSLGAERVLAFFGVVANILDLVLHPLKYIFRYEG